MEADAVSKKLSLGAGVGALIGLAALASLLGYLGFIAWIVGSAMNVIYGDYYRGAVYLKISDWMIKIWFTSAFFGMITVPVSLIIAVVTIFLPIARKAKIIISIIALGGALGWLISLRTLRQSW